MARQPRITVPGYAHHIIQRGNNRQAVVLDDEDRRRLLEGIQEYAEAAQVAVHAYVLMSNHLHLLATPATADGVPRMMQALGRSYVRHFNRRHERSGTLFEGRYRSTLIESERYLLACMAYIDLNPVRAGMVTSPADYPWSSYGHLIGLRTDPLMSPHPLYWALGNTPFERERAYAQLVDTVQGSASQSELTQSVHSGRALGSASFIADLERRTQRRLQQARRGRPPKSAG